MKNCLFIILLIISVISCIPHKKIIYFQRKGEAMGDTVFSMRENYKVQPTDIISINVSSFNSEATDFFNAKTNDKLGGYYIYPSGYIHLPVLDSIYVKDLTLYQIQDTLEKLIKEHVSNPYILVNLVNFKYTVLGEFRTTGIIPSNTNDLTIIEAIALAGDMTEFADKGRLKLIRKDGDKSIFITLDLNSREIMQSKYFYIHPNDVLYAEPLRQKTYRANVSNVSVYLSLISFAFIIYRFWDTLGLK